MQSRQPRERTRQSATASRIRAARPEEAGYLREIERASASRFLAIDMPGLAADEPTPAATLQQRCTAGHVLVSEGDDGAAVAFVMFRALDGCAYIEQIDVLPDHAGRRLGAALLDEVEAVAARAGFSALLLSTFREVPWNAPYYRRLGFEALSDASLGETLLAIRAEHIARGLDETLRVFMRRPVARE